MLALIPLPQEVHRLSAESIANRRLVAQKFAQAALERIEVDSELLDLTSAYRRDPEAETEQLRLSRASIHPQLPVELECILALLILSNYEHIQRGNLLKMAARTSQALLMAKGMSLHRQGPQFNKYTESRRRAWWMTVRMNTI